MPHPYKPVTGSLGDVGLESAHPAIVRGAGLGDLAYWREQREAERARQRDADRAEYLARASLPTDGRQHDTRL